MVSLMRLLALGHLVVSPDIDTQRDLSAKDRPITLHGNNVLDWWAVWRMGAAADRRMFLNEHAAEMGLF